MLRLPRSSPFFRAAAALALITAPCLPQPFTSTATAQVAASELVGKVDIPYSEFRLKNGLRVIVHTDRKAPVVAVSIWYDVGSKHEPQGKTGFAHLFEHLMFNGSENAPGDYFEPLQQVGATDFNGTTWFDRTNYFQTVPTSALEVALFLESDRMGHLLGAVTQEKLDNQRGVVQNEKRQGDNQPYGLVEYAQLAALLPPTHPYGHSTIGSMADLDSASLADVKQWFADHYGPNNAVLVLAGDIDAPTAKRLVTKYFGDIPAGPKVAPAPADIPTLDKRKDVELKDRVATTRLYRWWTAPGLNDPDAAPLAVGASVLGGLASSRLDNKLVKDEQLAVRVTADLQQFAQLSIFEVTADVKPGIDPALVSKRLDEILADYIAKGPTADEAKRVAMTDVSGRIGGMEQVGGFVGKAAVLAQSALYSGSPDAYKKQMMDVATATPEKVRAAMSRWLTRPVVALSVVPGEREAYNEAGGAAPAARSGVTSAPARYLDEGEQVTLRPSAAVDRSKLPEVGDFPNVDFPDVQTTALSNGIKLHFAHRDTVPTVRMSISFDAGKAADPKSGRGTQALMLAMLKEGTPTRNSIEIAEEQERLGASIDVGASADRTVVSLYALSPNLGPSLDLLADIVLHPAFDPKELERVRAAQLTQIAQESTEPRSIASRTLMPLLYGADHPYGIAASGSGDPAVVKALTRADLERFHAAWIRPDKAEIFAVGDTTLEQLKDALEQRFASWSAGSTPPGAKDFAATPPPSPVSRIVLVDRPQSPQSVIYAGQLLKGKGSDDLVNLLSANDIFGGDFLSRINMDLRETKGWSYGVRSLLDRNKENVAFVIVAPVQADRTGDSIAAIRTDLAEFLDGKGVTAEELKRTSNGSIRELPGGFETSSAVLTEMQRDALFGRPFDYVETLADKYRAQTTEVLNAAAREAVAPERIVWVVVGDKAIVKPQLDKLGIPVDVVEAADQAAPPAKPNAQQGE